MKSWIKGGLWGIGIFALIFVVLSLINTGKVSLSDAFGFKEAESLINYLLVLIFIVIGAFIGFIVGLFIKSKKSKQSKNLKGAKK
jgi:uncharacterized BrkB/YihY/UPF0761 family membrane protein